MNDDLIMKMILDESGFTAGMNSAVKKLGSFDNTISNTSKKSGDSMGSIWKVFAGSFLASGATKIISTGFNMVRDSVSGAIDRFDTLNRYPTVMKALGYSTKEVDSSMKQLTDGIDGLPTSLDEIVASAQQLAISTGSLDKGTKTAVALNNAFLASGASTADASRGMEQYRQMLGKGTVDMQSWRSIQETMPIAMDKVAKSFKEQGVNSVNELYDALKDGDVTFDEFNDRMIELNEGVDGFAELAKKNSAGIRTSFANIKTAVVKGVANVITAVNDGMSKAGFGSIAENFDKIKDVVNIAFSKIVEFIPPALDVLARVVGVLGQAFEAIKPFVAIVIENIPTVASILGGVISALVKFGSSLKYLMPILVPAATAFGAFMLQLKGIPTLIKNFNNLKNAITGIGKSLKIIGAIAAANPFVLIVGAIVGAIAVFGYFMATNEEFRNKVIAIWNDVKTVVIDTLKGIKEWGIKAWDSIKETASSAVQGVKDAWSGTKQWFSDTWSDIKEGAKGLFDTAVDSAKSGANKAKDSWGDAKQWFSSTWDSIKDTASKAWSTIQDAIMPYIGPLVYGIRNSFIHVFYFLEDLWTNLIEIGRNTFELLKNVILAPVLFITSMITGGWEETKHNMLAVWENIKEAAGNIWTSIQNIFSSYITNIYMAALNVWTGFKNTILNIWNEVVFQGKMIWIGIQSFFANLWIDIKYKAIQMWIDLKFAVIQTWIDLKYGAIETWNNIKQFFSDTWQSIKTGAADTWNAIKDTTVNVWNAIKQFFWDTVNNIVRTAQNAWNDLKQGVSDAINRVKNIFESLRDINLLEIGKNIIQGLIDGIAEKFNSLKKKVKDVASLIKNGITGALDINSPSRWMRDMVGKNIVQGIIVGLDQEKPKLDASMGGLVDTPVVNPSSNSQGASPSTVNARQTGTTNQQTEIHLHLNVYGDLPDSMVKALSKKLTTEITRQMKRDATAIGGALYAN